MGFSQNSESGGLRGEVNSTGSGSAARGDGRVHVGIKEVAAAVAAMVLAAAAVALVFLVAVPVRQKRRAWAAGCCRFTSLLAVAVTHQQQQNLATAT